MAVETKPSEVSTMPAATGTPTIVHYEIGAKNAEQLIGFYGGVFGWTFQGAPGMDTYKMAMTGKDGAVVAVYQNDGESKPTNYVGVDSVKTYVQKIKAHGGTIIHEFTVPFMGRGAVAMDPEQNPIGIWEEDHSAQPE